MINTSLISKTLVFTAMLAAILCSGCQRGPALGYVTGVVTQNGNPVPFAYVKFQVVEPAGTYASAYTNDNGEYVLQFSDTRNGALVGKHAITIRTSASDEIEIEDKSTGLMVTPPLPEGYLGRAEYEFSREVVPGSNRHDFDLVTPVSAPEVRQQARRQRRDFL